MPENSFTTDIYAPIKNIWEVMVDHQRYSKWSPAKRVTLEKETNGKGTIRVFRIGTKNGIIKVREEVIEWDPPNSMTYRLLSNWPVKNYEACMRLIVNKEQTKEVTQLIWESKWDNCLPSFLAAIPLKIMKASLIKFAKGIKFDAENTPDI